MYKFEERINTQKKKFMVRVLNLPPALDNSPNVAASDLKSLNLVNSNFRPSGGKLSSTTYESVLKERQDRVVVLC